MLAGRLLVGKVGLFSRVVILRSAFLHACHVDYFQCLFWWILADVSHSPMSQYLIDRYKFVMFARSSESPRPRSHNKSQTIQDRRSTPSVAKSAHTLHQPNKLKVFVKFRPQPFPPSEQDQVRYTSEKQIEIRTSLKHKIYKFDHVFSGSKGPKEVFQKGCKDIVDNLFVEIQEQSNKTNGLVFTYGSTGTGKTHSMGLLDLVDGNSRGIVPDSLRYIFNSIGKRGLSHYHISLSFCQVYMDQVYDLLALDCESRLAIREDAKTKEPFLENQMVIQVKSLEQAFQIINIGLDKRRVAEQRMNRRSSRGHGMIAVNIDANNGHKPAKICFVDLAGCERLKQSESKGTTLSQALHINSSLSSLETLLMNISEQSIRNYRTGKLTRLLQPYFQKGRINLFVTATKDSLNAIEFAKRCKGIKFMEKDLKQEATQAKRSKVSAQNHKSYSKEIDYLMECKRTAEQKEKVYLSCIDSLVSSLSKIARELQHCLKSQKGSSTSYSFSDIMNNKELELQINKRMEQYQRRQQGMLQQLLFKLSVVMPSNLTLKEVPAAQDIEELAASTQHFGQELSENIKGLSDFIDVRTVYRKQFFTSELKLHLLQQRCSQLEQGFVYLGPLMNPSDKRITRKLKQLGIGAENNENHSFYKSKPNSKRQKGKEERQPLAERKRQESHYSQDERSSSSGVGQKSTRRSAIFIDQF